MSTFTRTAMSSCQPRDLYRKAPTAARSSALHNRSHFARLSMTFSDVFTVDPLEGTNFNVHINAKMPFKLPGDATNSPLPTVKTEWPIAEQHSPSSDTRHVFSPHYPCLRPNWLPPGFEPKLFTQSLPALSGDQKLCKSLVSSL